MPRTALIEYAKPAQQKRSQQSLERVLEAAQTVLRRDGFEAMTMASVAAEAGVSVGGIYRRFNNKHALMLALHDTLVTGIERGVESRLARTDGLESVVREFVAVLVETLSADEELARMIFRYQERDKFLRARRAIDKAYEEFRAAVLRHASELASPDPEATIAVGFHLVYGSVMARVNQVGAAHVAHVSWPVLRLQLARALYGYLTMPAVASGRS